MDAPRLVASLPDRIPHATGQGEDAGEGGHQLLATSCGDSQQAGVATTRARSQSLTRDLGGLCRNRYTSSWPRFAVGAIARMTRMVKATTTAIDITRKNFAAWSSN